MQQISTAQTDRYAECNGQCSLLMGGSHINKNGDDKQENECSWVELVLFENKKKCLSVVTLRTVKRSNICRYFY